VLRPLIVDAEYFRFGFVKDIVMLHGYDEPTMLVLHEPKFTHEGYLLLSSLLALSLIFVCLEPLTDALLWHEILVVLYPSASI
jgi:hypothetical protein